MSNQPDSKDEKQVPCKNMVMPEFGDKVAFDHYYYRCTEQKKDGAGYFRTHKIWTERLCNYTGIFLGTRTLQDGWRDYDSDAGCTFSPTRHYRVALISPGPKENPLYVPLTAIKA